MKQWIKAYYLFLNIHIDCRVLGKNLHALELWLEVFFDSNLG